MEKLSYYQAEINEMHPFREGNGRTQRAFLRQLPAEAGYRLDWTVVDADENIKTALAAHQGNLGPLRAMLEAVASPLL